MSAEPQKEGGAPPPQQPYGGQPPAQEPPPQQMHPYAQQAPPPYQQQPQPQGGQPYPQGGQPYPQGGQPPPTYPQQPGYAPGPQPASAVQTTVVVQQRPMVGTHYGESPAQVNCPYCHQQVVTRLDYRTGTMTWVVAGVLCFIGCDLGCCLIPFCVNGCKDIIHICPNCQQELGRKSRM